MRKGLGFRLVAIGSLYVAQALPIGFFQQALPVMLRAEGLPLAVVSLANLMALPWVLKFLWAPMIDRGRPPLPGWGQRRGWIVPLQLLAGALALVLAATDLGPQLWPLFLILAVLNLVSASQDVATDGLAVLLLGRNERGPGNAVQAAGYQIGLVLGGGVLLILFDYIGWRGAMAAMAVALLMPLLPLTFLAEPEAPPAPLAAPPPRQGWQALRRYLERPHAKHWLGLICLFLLGNIWAMTIYKPLLVDVGFSLEQVGWLNGVVGIGASVAGAALAGVLLSRLSRRAVLVIAFAALAAGVGSLIAVAAAVSGLADASLREWMIAALVLNKFAGGVGGAALFTLMMDHTRPSQPGTDFTIQQSTFNAATATAAVAGPIAGLIGYVGHFTLCLILCVGTAVVILGRSRLVVSGVLSGENPRESAAE